MWRKQYWTINWNWLLLASFALSRLEAIAGDAELQEKAQADLKRLGTLLHDSCVKAVEDYNERLKADNDFDGEGSSQI